MGFQYYGSNTVVTAATLQGLSANTQYWIDRQGNLVSVGGSSLTAATVPKPTDQAIYEGSLNQGINLYIKHAALTGAAGGIISIAEIWPELPSGDILANEVRVVGTPPTQALAATAETLVKQVIAPYTGARLVKFALAILFTTVPTTASTLTLGVWGFDDARMRAR